MDKLEKEMEWKHDAWGWLEGEMFLKRCMLNYELLYRLEINCETLSTWAEINGEC